MYDGNLLKENVDSITIRQLKAEVAALKAELAQQANNTGSPKLPTLVETLAHFNCDQELYTDDQRLTHGLIERCYNFICRQLRAGA